MLSQTCHPDLFQNQAFDYQEVPVAVVQFDFKAFVIHCIHDTATIYYCNFPNAYLAAIHRHGATYLDKTITKPRVALRRTRKYHFRNPSELCDLFQELANLLWYLSSGNARVGCLFNYPSNPLKKLVIPSSVLKLMAGSSGVGASR